MWLSVERADPSCQRAFHPGGVARQLLDFDLRDKRVLTPRILYIDRTQTWQAYLCRRPARDARWLEVRIALYTRGLRYPAPVADRAPALSDYRLCPPVPRRDLAGFFVSPRSRGARRGTPEQFLFPCRSRSFVQRAWSFVRPSSCVLRPGSVARTTDHGHRTDQGRRTRDHGQVLRGFERRSIGPGSVPPRGAAPR